MRPLYFEGVRYTPYYDTQTGVIMQFEERVPVIPHLSLGGVRVGPGLVKRAGKNTKHTGSEQH